MSEGDTSTNDNSNTQRPQHGFQVALDYMMERKIDSLLWLTRLGTIVFTVLSIFPFFNLNSYTCYQRALMSNAATSALRLHQRMPRVQLTREFGAMLLIEDSCHYLLYSILFIISYPITLSLLPIFMFAGLHSVTYSKLILSKIGSTTGFSQSILTYTVEHQHSILRLVAFAEVCLLPITIMLLFSGKGSLLTPFAYYRFLSLRYASRRNPYTRNVFHEMRLFIEGFANSPGRNPQIRNVCHKIVNFVLYFAPPTPAQ